MPRPALPRPRRWTLTALALAAATALQAQPVAPPPATLPQGGQVLAGSATLQSGGSLLTVRQASERLVTQWDRFDIGADATVRFLQPGRGSIALNRVLAQEPSAIFGRLQADGQVFLINPSGVLFGAGARVDVGGLVASSLDLSDADFLAGRMRFQGPATAGAVHNAGRISAGEGGYIAFLAPQVVQAGELRAPQGDVVLAAGQAARLDFAGDRLLSFSLDAGTVAALVEQQGLVQAEGGRVLLTARAAEAARQAVVNQAGIVDAGSLVARGGRIVLEADEVKLRAGSRTEARGASGGGQVLAGGGWGGSGPWRAARQVSLEAGAQIDASGASAGGEVVLWSALDDASGRTVVDGEILARGAPGAGGRIETSGHALAVSGRVDAGPGGLWLLDPVNITVTTTGGSVPPGGGSYGTAGNVQASSIVTALNNGNSVVLDTSGAGASQGDITVASDIVTGAMAADATLTFKANRNIVVNAGVDIDATGSGNTKKLNLVFWADQDGSGGGAIQLGASGSTAATLLTNGGGVWLGGGSGTASWTPYAGASALTVGNGSATGTDAALTGWGIAAYNTSITTAGGHLAGRGRSEKNAGTSDVALGISLQGSSLSSGAGHITLAGEVANTSGTTVDITLGLTAHSGTTIASTSGDITLTGTLDASTRAARGAGIWLGTQLGAAAATGDVSITSTSGAIALTGSGADAAGSGFRHGLMLRNQFAGDDILVRSTSGAITLEGQAAYRSAIDVTTGLQFQNDTTSGTIRVVSQSGAITLRGGNTQDGNVNENDLRFQLADTSAGLRIGYDGSSAYSGHILIEADALYQSQQAGAGSIAIQGSGTLTLRPAGSSFTQLRAGASGTISFDDDWAFGSTLTGLTLGKAGNTTALTLSSPITVAGPLQVTGGALALNAALTSQGELRLTSTGDIVQAAGVAVQSQGGAAIYHADSDGSGAGMVYLKAGASLATQGGAVWMGGGSGNSTWNSLSVGDDYARGDTVIPKAELMATASDDFKNGITLYNASLDSGGGPIALYGRSGTGSDVFGYIGIHLAGSSSVSSGAGALSLSGQAAGGTSSGASGWHHGVLMLPTANDGSTQGTVALESTSGAIAVTGSAQHDQSAPQSAGLALLTQAAGGTARIRSTTGAITLTGSNLNASHPSDGGLQLAGSGTVQVVSQSGAIRLEGSSASTSVPGLNLATGRIGSDGSTAYSGAITLVSDRLTLDAAALLQSSGTLTVEPASAGTSIGLGDGSGTLVLPATAFSTSFVDGFAAIVVGRSDGSGATTVGSATARDPLTLRSGSGGVALDGSFAAQQGLTLEAAAGLSGSGSLALGNGQALSVTQSGDSVFGGVVSGTGATLTKAGSGRLTLTADQTYTGTTTVAAGTLALGQGGSAGQVAGDLAVTGALVLDRSDEWTLAGTISGSGTLAMDGSGTVTLTGSNSYSGGTTVNAGRLYAGEDSQTRTAFGSGSVTVRSGATLWLDRATLDNALVLDGGLLYGSNGFGEVLRGAVTVASDSSVDSSFSMTLSGTVSGSGVLTLANSWRDEGELRITGSDTRTAGTVLTAGVLRIGSGGTSGSVAGPITTTVQGSVVFQRSDNVTHAGAITGPGSVTQAGSGTLTLGNAAAHTGATTISAGTLAWASDAPAWGTSGFSGPGRLVVQPAGSGFSGPLDLGSLPPLASNLGGLTVGSTTNAAALTLASPIAIAGDITLLTGDLTLASGAALASSGGHITLSVSRFVNQAGASVFSPGSGRRWRVWSRNADPFDAGTGDQRGGLAYQFKQYGATYGSSTVLGSGNGLLYTLAPTLTPTLSGASKVYDGTSSVTVSAGQFGAIGAVDGDSVQLATPTTASFTGGSASQAGSGKAVQASGVTLSGASNGSATVYGYTLASNTATGSDGEITPAALVLSGSKVYDGGTAMPGSALVATGVNGESFAVTGSGASGNLAGKQVQTAQPLASVAGLSLGSGSGGAVASNYQALSTTGSSVSVTARPLVASGVTAADKVYDGTAAATLDSSGLVLSGRVDGDDLSLSVTGSFADKQVGSGKAVTLSGSLGGSDAGNYSFTPQAGASASITARPLTVGGITAADKVYDGTTAATLALGGLALTGLVNGDDVTVSASGSFGDKHVGSGKTVTLSTSLGGSDLGNYTVTAQATTTASITARPLTVSGFSAADKVYDGGTAATVLSTGLTLAGLVNGDDLSITATGSFADKHAGSGKAVALTTSIAGSDAGNYAVTAQSGTTASITARPLTLGGLVAADKVYDGTTAATVLTTGLTLGGLVAGDDLGVTASGSFADKHAGSGKTVALSTALTGADAGNYSLGGQTGTTASITPRPLTLGGVTAADKVYDGTIAATLSTAAMTLSGLLGGDDVVLSASGSFGDKQVGSGKAVTLATALGGADAGNYSLGGQTGTSASITPRPLTVGGLTAADKVYDGTTTATVGLSGLSLSGLVPGDDIAVAASGSFADKHVGSGKAVTLSTSLGGSDLGNYTVTVQTGTTATITARPLTVSGLAAADKVYDGNTTATVLSAGLTLAGLVAGDDLSVAATGSFADKHAGTGKTVTLSASYAGADLGNYSISGQAGTTASIAPRPLVVSGLAAADKVYDGTTAATVLTTGLTLAGLVAGDELSVSATGTFADKQAGSGKTVVLSSSYGGADLGNYALTGQTTATAAITPRPLVVAGLGVADKVYDGGTAATVLATGLTLTGRVAGDDLALTATGQFADKQVGGGKAVALLQSLGGADAGNYSLVPQAGTSAAITPRPLTVSGLVAADKVYDGTTTASVSTAVLTLSGLVAGDEVGVSATGAFADKHVGNGKTVTLAVSYGGADLGNYSITGQTGTTASIAPRPLTVSGLSAADKVYDGTTAASVSTAGLVLSGLVAGDELSVGATGSFADKQVGSGKTVTLVASYGGADLGNYAIGGQTATTASIAPRPLTLSGLAGVDKVYDGTTAAPLDRTAMALAGAVAGDDLGLVVSGRFADRHAGSGKTVTLDRQLTGGDAGNYLLGGQTGTTASITPRPLTVGGLVAADKVYDGTTAATVLTTGLTLSGLVAGDDLGFNATGQFADKHAGSGKTVLLSTTATGADAGNYQLTAPAATTASIAPRVLNLVLQAQDKVYDGGTAAPLAMQDDRLAGDALVVTASAAFADRHVGTAKPVALQSVALGGADAGNYVLAPQGPGMASILQRPSVTWIGAPGGDWMDASQWADGALPDGANVARVVLPAGASPRLTGGLVQLQALDGAGAALAQSGGTLAIAGAASLGHPDAPLLLGDLRVGGSLALTAASVAMAPGGQLQAGGPVSLQGGSVTLAAAGPLRLGTLDLAGDLSLQVDGALDLGRGRTGGALSAQARGDIGQTGALQVGAGLQLDAGPGAVRLLAPGNLFLGPVAVRGDGGVLVAGASPEGLATVQTAAAAAPAAPLPEAAPPAALPLSWPDPAGAAGPALATLPLVLDGSPFDLEWTGRELRLRPRSPAAAALAEAQHLRLVQEALRLAAERWGLPAARIAAVRLAP